MRREDFVLRRSFRPYMPSAILVLLLGATLIAWGVSHRSISLQKEARFDSLASQVERNIRYRMQTYGNALMQTRSLFHQVPRLDRRTFREYVSDLHILDVYPGILGIGYAENIRRGQLRRHEQAVRRGGSSGYHVWPNGRRDTYTSVVYLEPLANMNKRAIGFDMSTEPARKEAMDRARDTGTLAASGTLDNVQETRADDTQPGFVLYVPLYMSGRVPPTVAERRRQLLGFIYSPFRAPDLFEAVLRPHAEALPLAVQVSSVRSDGSTELLYHHGEPAPSPLSREVSLDVAGQRWLLDIKTNDQFSSLVQGHVPKLVLLVGIFLSGLCYWFLFSSQALARAERERARQLETLIRTSRVISGKLELTPLVQAVTDAGRELSGAAFGAFFYHGRPSSREGEQFSLYALSGAKRSDFEKFPMVRKTQVFAPTFEGAVVRSDDITADPRYGQNIPYNGMPEGHLKVLSYLAVPVKTRSGEAVGFLLYGHPEAAKFSEREEQLVVSLASQAAVAMDNAHLFESAQEAVRVRDEFLSIASHELKTPLTPLKLHLQGLLRRWDREGNHDEQARKMARNADRQITRLTRLVDDLLDVSRISAGLLRLNREEVDLAEVLRESAERFTPQLTEAGNTVHLELPTSMKGSFDRLRIEQVVANLISNAIRYAPGSAMHIFLRSSADRVLLVVEDNGPGVAPEKREQVFERFERVAPDAGALGGLGLGLFIVRQIIEAHGGRILLKPAIGHGARFEIDMPLEPLEAAAAPSATA